MYLLFITTEYFDKYWLVIISWEHKLISDRDTLNTKAPKQKPWSDIRNQKQTEKGNESPILIEIFCGYKLQIHMCNSQMKKCLLSFMIVNLKVLNERSKIFKEKVRWDERWRGKRREIGKERRRGGRKGRRGGKRERDSLKESQKKYRILCEKLFINFL